MNPFTPTENIVMTIHENPFTPTVLGKGGVGSGSFLDVKPGDPAYEKRRSDQVKNAQRLYRQLNRDKYNEYMKEFTKTYYAKNPDKKKERSESMSLANDKYRMKKKILYVQSAEDKLIKKEAELMWKEDPAKPKRPKGRPKIDKATGKPIKTDFDDSMPKDYIKKHYNKLYENMLESAHIKRSELERLGLSLDDDINIGKKPHLTDFSFDYVDKEGQLLNEYGKPYNLSPSEVEEYWNKTVIPNAKRRANETPAERLARKERAKEKAKLRKKK